MCYAMLYMYYLRYASECSNLWVLGGTLTNTGEGGLGGGKAIVPGKANNVLILLTIYLLQMNKMSMYVLSTNSNVQVI